MFIGTFVALITPFRNGQIDELALRKLVNFQCEQGIEGIVVCASTGEGFTLEMDEHKKIIETVIDETKGRVPVIASASSFTTKHTLILAKQAEACGVDGLMIVTPPYIKPSAQALEEYFTYIHDNTNKPIILYDNPTRGSVVIPFNVVLNLAKLPRIVALKDAAGDIVRPALLTAALPENFTLISGEDITTLAFMAHGGKGVISVTANVAPALMKQQIQAWERNDKIQIAKIRTQLLPLYQAMYCEPSPAAVKYACSLLGLCRPEVRLPMLPLTPNGQQHVKQVMRTAQIAFSE